MDIIQAIIIGIIEGFTEFLPISSTGHMIVASKFMGIEESALMKAYEVIIQFAAILAVMLIYREKISFEKNRSLDETSGRFSSRLLLSALFLKML